MSRYANIQYKPYKSLFLNISTRYANFFDMFRSVTFSDTIIDPVLACTEEESLASRRKENVECTSGDCGQMSDIRSMPFTNATIDTVIDSRKEKSLPSRRKYNVQRAIRNCGQMSNIRAMRSMPFTSAVISPVIDCNKGESLTSQQPMRDDAEHATNDCDQRAHMEEEPTTTPSACDALKDPIVQATQQKRIESCGGSSRPKPRKMPTSNNNNVGPKMPLAAAHCRPKSKAMVGPPKASHKSFRDQLLDPNTVFELQTWDQKATVQYSCVEPKVWSEVPMQRTSTNGVIYTRLPRPLYNKMLW